MAIFVTFKTKDTMKSFFILLSLYCFFVVNVVNGKSVTFPSRVEIIMDEDFDLPDGPGNGHRSIPPVTPFLAFLNDDHSIDCKHPIKYTLYFHKIENSISTLVKS